MQHPVTAEEVAPQIIQILRTIPLPALDRFEESLEQGELIGRYWDRCFFGTVARSCHLRLSDPSDRERVFAEVCGFTRERFKITLSMKTLHPIEYFCHEVRGNQTARSSPVVAYLLVLVSETRLMRLGQTPLVYSPPVLSLDDLYETAGEATVN